MSKVTEFYGSTIGKKAIVAVTGLILFGFLIGHMLGNLKTFAGSGPDGVAKLDHYAEFLRAVGTDFAGRGVLLWGARLVLLGALILHVVCILQLAALNKSARPVGYACYEPRASTAAARTMLVGGVLILIFVVLHLLHFTTGDLHLRGFVHGHVYANVYAAFSLWWVTALYVAAMVVVSTHIYHGVWSLCQTLGLDSPDRNKPLRCLSQGAAVVLFVGFVAVPLAINLGFLPPPPSVFLPEH